MSSVYAFIQIKLRRLNQVGNCNRFELYFNQIFDPNSWNPNQLSRQNWLIWIQIWFEIFEINQKRSKIYWSFNQHLSDLFQSFNFNWKYIDQIELKMGRIWSKRDWFDMLQFRRQILNCTKINLRIWTAWNQNRQQFNSRALIA